MKKKVITSVVLLFIIFSVSIFFILRNKEEKIDYYSDPTLKHLGMTEEEILNLYGEPDFEGKIGGPGGRSLFYKKIRTSFVFAGEESVVNNLELFPGAKILEVKVGMSFDEITKILGPPRERGYDQYGKDYAIVYYFGEEKEGMAELEVWFSASDDSAPTKKAQVFWKKYWQ